MSKELTYSEAISELESILKQIEQDDIPVDELLEKVKRSSELIIFCKDKLTKTESEVHAVLEDLQEPDEDTEEEDYPPESAGDDTLQEPGTESFFDEEADDDDSEEEKSS
ncbi:MAG: exodeoxyribonuclease VII small subunit [Bacteroidales bacterium]|nr:exodeoxyribonuclease VII small subunit [Bacteroidales bacterium]